MSSHDWRIDMSTDLTTLGLDKLSVQERLDLIDKLWDSLPDQLDQSMLPDWHLAEIAQRRAKTGAGAAKPWRSVLDALEAKP
jgi:putative addiction module component (TIGR02574 family)